MAVAGKLFRSAENGLTHLSAILLAGMVLTVLAGIASRLTGIRVPGVIEISSFFLIAIVFLPLARVTRAAIHVRVQFVNNLFPPRLKRIVEIVTGFFALVVVILIAVLCWQMFYETLKSGSVTIGSPHIALWIPQLPIALGMSLAGARMVLDLIKAIWFHGN